MYAPLHELAYAPSARLWPATSSPQLGVGVGGGVGDGMGVGEGGVASSRLMQLRETKYQFGSDEDWSGSKTIAHLPSFVMYLHRRYLPSFTSPIELCGVAGTRQGSTLP